MSGHSSSPILVMYAEGSLPQQEWCLELPVMSIGRDAENDIVIPDRKVSRRHAIIRLERGRWVIEDQSSRNGTFLRGQMIQQPCFLQDGEEICIANKFRLVFVDTEMTMPSTLLAHVAGEATQTGSLAASTESSANAYASEPMVSPYRLSIDHKARRIWVNGHELHPPLSSSQYAMLELLYRRVGEVVSREDLARKIWPKASGIVSEQAIDSLVWRLRKRIAELDPEREYITTVRGHGIRLEEVF